MTKAATAPNPTTSPGVSLTSERDEERDEHRVGERAPRPPSWRRRRGRRARRDGERRADRVEVSAGPRARAGRRRRRARRRARRPTACVTWLDPPSAASRPTSDERRERPPRRRARRPARVEPRASRADEERRVRGEQHEQPAAVRAEAAARDRDQRRRRRARPRRGRAAPDRGSPGRAASSPAGWRRRRSGPPATGRTGTARRTRGRGRGRGGRRRARRRRRARAAGRAPRARGARRATSRRARGSRRAPSRTTRGARPGAKTRHDVREPADEHASGGGGCGRFARSGARAATGCATGSRDSDDLEPAVRDVGERDEPVDPRRARREDAARPGGHRDRVAGRSRSGPAGEGRRACRAAALRRARSAASPRDAPPSSELTTFPVRSVLRALCARDGRPCARDGEPDRAAARVPVERERLDDAHRRDGRRGHDERKDEQLRGRGSRGESRPTRDGWRRLCGVIVERSMDSRWLSNAFVVGDEPGGVAVFVDSGAPLEPLLDDGRARALTPTHILRTHGHRGSRGARGRARGAASASRS